MASAQLHSDVDVLSRSQALGQNESAFVDQRNQNTVDHEAGSFLNDDGVLPRSWR